MAANYSVSNPPCHKPRRSNSIRVLASTLLVTIVAVAGCQSTPLPRPQAPTSSQAPEVASKSTPQQLLRQAAQRHQQGQTSVAAGLYLQAAQSFLSLQDYAGAKDGFARIASTGVNLAQTDRSTAYHRVAATLALHERRFAEAAASLNQIIPGRDGNPSATARVRSGLCAANQDWSCAATSLMGMTNLQDNPPIIVMAPPPEPVHLTETEGQANADNNAASDTPSQLTPMLNQANEQRVAPPVNLKTNDIDLSANGQTPASVEQQHNDEIWHYVNRTPLHQTANLAATAPGAQRGWWQLQLAAVSGFRGADQKIAVNQWQRSNGAHPAQYPWPTALAQLLQPSTPPQRVALLLPLSGPLAAAGSAVRDGFISAYLHNEGQVEVEVFDSNAQPIEQTFSHIQQWQADVVLGPLAKGNLERINALDPSMPVLGLNYLADNQPTSANLFQLGLAIEDEADTLVARLLADGYERILVLHSEQDWAVRAANQLSRSWPHNLTVEPFADVRTVTEAVGRGMFVDASQLRSQRIYQLINSHIEFIPRARTDLDAVVAIMDNTQANALVPALKFHFASQLPVYASSQTVRGAKRAKIAPLAGFRVSELPWLMLTEPLQQTVQDSFSLRGSSLSSLYALGADAYRVADRLPILRVSTDLGMLGNTGALWVDAQRRFHRQQQWGVVSDGKLIPMPTVVDPASDTGAR